MATWLDLFCLWKCFRTFMTLVITHLLPAASALYPYPLCTGLCSSLFYLSVTPLEQWRSYFLILKARKVVSKEGICPLLLLVIPYSSFYSLQEGWSVLIKMSILVLVLVKHSQERSFKCGWGAGNDGRDLVSIWWCYYFWPASWKSSSKTLWF